MKLLLLGPVGSGKGTMAALISKNYHIPQISTGEIFRWNISNNTELGKIVKPYVETGNLVPEELTVKLVQERLQMPDCKNGYILDGFPRNIEQAQALSKFAELDKVIFLNISENEILKRLTSRRMCTVCNQPTSLEWLKNNKCEKCGGEVYTRKDDSPEVVLVRLKTNKVSDELLDFYKNKGIFNQINVGDSVEDNYQLIENVLK